MDQMNHILLSVKRLNPKTTAAAARKDIVYMARLSLLWFSHLFTLIARVCLQKNQKSKP